ncbi:ABC transporter permease [Fervidicoccus fontis]|jgi:molybdate/tungstate transport system permease protein|uniref:Binding-protein-dependent transport systems inner membrane component n=2 Tax=Fervidicoccus fontis TaxID=683846 RepID=I0A1Y4_FERFK|nr:ABC transporter permease [Fervidicoccus fontis]AFH42991.1 binding-protein-dependent transport systems inner membrane component [Fervidicoccus fontis Kam940]MBE9391455.1 ABC transporter permease [Fervidicoccus fontis]
MSTKFSLFLLTFIILSGILLLFFSYPIAVIFAVGISGALSSFKITQFELGLLITIIASSLAALASIVFGIPLAYILARYNFRFKEVIETIVDIPIAVPHMIVGIMIVLSFAQYYGFGALLQTLGIKVIDTIFGAVLAVLYVSSTYAVRIIESAIKGLDPEIENVALSLGAPRAITFFSVVIPNIKKALANAILTSWARASSEAGALLIVAYQVNFAGNFVYPASVAIYEAYVGLGVLEAARFSVAMLILILGIYLATRAVLRWKVE